MWGAAEAVELGLIDAVEGFDAAFSNLAARAAQSKKGVGTMNGPTGQPRTAATLQELRTVCVGADDSFLLSQLGSGATIDEAGRAWITRQAELLTEARAQAAAGRCSAAAAGRRVLPKLADPKRLLSIRVATSVIAAWKAKARGG